MNKQITSSKFHEDFKNATFDIITLLITLFIIHDKKKKSFFFKIEKFFSLITDNY